MLMAPATDEDTKRLFEGLDYLGKPSEISAVGGQDISAGVQGLPAAGGPGGMQGFAGGPGGPSGVSGGQATPDIAGFVQKILGKVGEQKGQPGVGPASGFPEGGDPLRQEIATGGAPPSDVFNPDIIGGGPDLSALLEQFPGAGKALMGEIGAGGAPPSDVFNPGEIGGSVGGSAAGSLAGMAVGPLLSYLGRLATKDSSPEMQAAISGLTQALAPAAAPAAAGAVSGAAAGTGALTGAAGGLAAAGPGLIAAAPIAAMMIATSINSMLTQQAMAGQLQDRFKGLSSSLPGHISNIQKAPQLLEQLNSASTPEQATDIYRQLEKISQDFEQSGIENFLKSGSTSVTGPSGQGSLSAGFEQGPEIYKQLSPFLQAMDVGRMRATDIAARGGKPIEGARSIYDYGFSGGGPEFSEAIRPGSTNPGGELMQFLLGLGVAPNTSDVVPQSIAPEELAAGQPGAAVRTFAGIAPSNTTPVSLQDMTKSFSPGGANWGRIEPGSGGAQYIQTNYGLVDRNLFDQLAAIQPGNYEQGLAELWKPYGGGNIGLERYGFGTGGMPPTSPLAGQIGALIGGGGAGTGLAEGMLSEEERRRLGQ
jgi:hypothetical protein